MVYLSEKMQIEREEVYGAMPRRVPCVELQLFSRESHGCHLLPTILVEYH